MSSNQEEYKKHLLEIMARLKNGEATEAEIREIDRWYEESASEEKYAEGMTNSEKLQAKEKMLQRINSRIYKEAVPVKKINTYQNWKKLAMAAIVLVIAGAGLFYFSNQQVTKPQIVVTKNDVAPGGNKAFLTLANGRKISLTDAANGAVAKQTGVSITKTADGQLVYTAGNVEDRDLTTVEYNTIETPRGGQYQVQLPDGSKVWLNAASSLKYPSTFASAADRRVELTGEGYFEIAKDKAHPFIVESKGQQVEVLGTHFNINTYEDEPNIKTALLEGSIRLTGNGFNQTLKPGQEARRNGSNIKIVPDDEEETLAWKNGQFVFNDESLESIMRKVARWYDVEVKYGDVNRSETYGGSFNRYRNVSAVLKKLMLTGGIKFKIEGKTIYVLPDHK